MSMSPRTRIALTADPASSGSGCLSSLTEPAPITGTIPAAANCGANWRTASSENPLNTRGESMGFRYCAKPCDRTRKGSRKSRAGRFSRSVRDRGLDGRRFFGWRLVERVDLEHVGDRSNAGDRFLREFANAECDGARELAIEINRASAHSRNNAGIFDLLSRAGARE